jgi:hypothetical protein
MCRGNTQTFIFIYVPLYSCDHMISTTVSTFGLKKTKQKNTSTFYLVGPGFSTCEKKSQAWAYTNLDLTWARLDCDKIGAWHGLRLYWAGLA